MKTDINLKGLGKYLAKERKEEGYTQAEIAHEINASFGSIVQLEGGRARMRFDVFIDYCSTVGIDPTETYFKFKKGV